MWADVQILEDMQQRHKVEEARMRRHEEMELTVLWSAPLKLTAEGPEGRMKPSLRQSYI